MTFVESYLKNLSGIRFITLITAAFLLSLLSFELLQNLSDSWYPQSEFESDETINIRNVAIFFQSIIFAFFLVRMILVCFTKPKLVWISQSFWILHWLAIFLYAYVSSELDTRFDREHFPSFFLTMLNGVSTWFLAYMILSPIKQILTLILSYFYRK